MWRISARKQWVGRNRRACARSKRLSVARHESDGLVFLDVSSVEFALGTCTSAQFETDTGLRLSTFGREPSHLTAGIRRTHVRATR
ncbi:hypothetical protein BRD12_05635 [Halobacteriales archaeon SW_12_67_38]|nr:MAG: hypothetical protein BRD12_05635 [Halobacteriales archaeon SW_12_67_38]